MILTVLPDGSGDVPDVSSAVAAYIAALNAGEIGTNEPLVVNLALPGDYLALPIDAAITVAVQAGITIQALPAARNKARIVPAESSWLSYTCDVFLGSWCPLTLSGLVLVGCPDGLINIFDQDLVITQCRTQGNGLLATATDGQISITQTIGDPLDVTVAGGDETRAAKDPSGAGLTWGRPSLLVTLSRLGYVNTNKPARITRCSNCNGQGMGLNAFAETTAGNDRNVARASVKRVGNLLDDVSFNFGNGGPWLSITDGGLYRRLTLGDGVAGGTCAIRLTNANAHFTCIDRCRILNCGIGVEIIGFFGVLYLTNCVLVGVAMNIVNRSCPFLGRIVSRYNRNAHGGDVSNACNVDSCS